MKVAVYSHSIPPAVDGVSRRFTSIIHELHKAGHEVVVFTLEKEPLLENTLFPGQKQGKFKYVHLESTFHELYPSKRIAAPTLSNLISIINALLRERPDVVHCTADAITLQFGLVSKLLGIPVVTSIHTDVQLALQAVGAPHAALYLTNLKEKMEGALLDGCATTSASFRVKLRAQGVLCDHVVKTAVLVDRFTPERACAETRSRLTFGNSDAFLIVYVGRLAPEKGLDALVSMAQSVDNCYLAIIGDGPMGARLAAQHGAASRLYCVPGFLEHDELPAVYASADAHATCSLFETLGNTVLEAHACGIPVVVPRTQGFVDTVTHGSDGFLYDPKRPVQEGGAALRQLRDSAALRLSMGAAGRLKVQQQSPERVAGDIVEWYGASAQRLLRESSLSSALRTSQLVGAVAILLAAWNLYSVPAALHRALRQAFEQLRCAIASSHLVRTITASYASLSWGDGAPSQELDAVAKKR